MRIVTIIFLLLLAGVTCNGQNNYQPRFWNLLSLSGELELNGYYKVEEIKGKNYEKRSNSLFSGGGNLKSKSYFWHPNFLEIDLDLGYNPSLNNQSFYTSPDRKLTGEAKNINFRTRLFKNKNINLSTYFNYDESAISRENLNNINTDNFSLGGAMSYLNKYAPLTINYKKSISNQQELKSERSYRNEQSIIEGQTKRFFGDNNRSYLNFYHKEFLYKAYNLSEISNEMNEVNLRNTSYFNSKDTRLNSRIIYFDQEAGPNNYDRFQINENLSMRLPKNLKLNVDYNYLKSHQNIHQSNQHTYNASLNHKLYLSLISQIEYNYYKNTHSLYELNDKNYTASLSYTKKIPLNGALRINYSYDFNEKINTAAIISAPIYNEPYQLVDSEIVLLRKAAIDINTIIVKDELGTIIYQLNVDYILTDRGDFIEIQRIPGGLIANNDSVLIDYEAVQSGSYRYDGKSTSFYAGVSLFQSKFEFYYKELKQEYSDVSEVLLSQDDVNQKVYGSRVDFGFINTLVEYEEYDSKFLPFRLLRLNAISQGKLFKKLSYAINGNYRKYFMIFEEGLQQEYTDFSTNLNYSFNYKTTMSLYGGYRSQTGDGVSINLLTGKVELKTRLNSLYLNASLEMYKNKYDQLDRDFTNIKVRIIRKF